MLADTRVHVYTCTTVLEYRYRYCNTISEYFYTFCAQLASQLASMLLSTRDVYTWTRVVAIPVCHRQHAPRVHSVPVACSRYSGIAIHGNINQYCTQVHVFSLLQYCQYWQYCNSWDTHNTYQVACDCNNITWNSYQVLISVEYNTDTMEYGILWQYAILIPVHVYVHVYSSVHVYRPVRQHAIGFSIPVPV